MKRTSIFILIFLLFATFSATIGAEIPYLTGRVNDYAQILSESTIKSLSEGLKRYEDSTTNQVVVLTIPSLEGESIEDFSYKVFNDWKLGQKDKNNGVLIVVVPDERKMRIEVGYGLEATLTDLLASRIIRNVMAPRFREEDYNSGISEGAAAVISILNGNGFPEGDEIAGTEDSSENSSLSDLESPDLPITERILFGAFIFGIIGLFTFLGLVTPGFGWFLYFFLIPFWAMFPIVVVGTHGALICFLVYLIGFPIIKIIIKNTSWYKKANVDLKTKGKANIRGFVLTSGGSGGSWSSGGSSGGGFSGGGGSSGSW